MEVFRVLQDGKCNICHQPIEHMDDATFFDDTGIIHIRCFVMDSIDLEDDD